LYEEAQAKGGQKMRPRQGPKEIIPHPNRKNMSMVRSVNYSRISVRERLMAHVQRHPNDTTALFALLGVQSCCDGKH
tara:strand:- start:1105 stop:1335 length:231 start_codon:yes stop_codon:yes gene_type:complete